MDGRRNCCDLLGGFVHRHFLLLLLAAYALAAVWPWLGMTVKDIVLTRIVVLHEAVSLTLPMLLLASLLLNAGLSADASELAKLVQQPYVVLAGLVMNLLLPVGFAALLIQGMRLWHNPDETQNLLVGLAIVAAMPVAGSSTAWSQNANGNVALSLGLVILSTLLSPITTPLILLAFGSMANGDCALVLQNLIGTRTGSFLMLCVVIPSLAGLMIRKLLGGQRIARWKPRAKFFNSAVLLFLCYTNASISLPHVVGQPDWDFLVMILVVVVALCLSAFTAGWLLARFLHVDESQQRSLMFGLGMNNNGTGMVLASTSLVNFPFAILPVLLYNLVQHLVAGGVNRSLAGPGFAGAPRRLRP
jgi:BASS family bile acid:Na+ symporter